MSLEARLLALRSDQPHLGFDAITCLLSFWRLLPINQPCVNEDINDGFKPRFTPSIQSLSPAAIRICFQKAIRTARGEALAVMPSGSSKPSAPTIPATFLARPFLFRSP